MREARPGGSPRAGPTYAEWREGVCHLRHGQRRVGEWVTGNSSITHGLINSQTTLAGQGSNSHGGMGRPFTSLATLRPAPRSCWLTKPESGPKMLLAVSVGSDSTV